ncbi:hypothetical protein [Streptomyces sp. NPDC047968]|uniref:hypothetical protein n=1 Tax=unclassified Streptomyces TaxID=2593676 RepID=UPI0034210DFD
MDAFLYATGRSLALTGQHGQHLARTGTAAEQLWLLGGVVLSLTAAGVVAVAAVRGRKRDH